MKEAEVRSFWAFSLSIYERPGLPDALIAVQDRHGADVNMLLYCCWCGLTGRRQLSSADILDLEGTVSGWRQGVVHPLRGLRRDMKNGYREMPRGEADNLRESIKSLELEAERIEQLFLQSRTALPEETGSIAIARANLEVYLEIIEVPLDGVTQAAIELLLNTEK
jgi:uncharacterized protein (TIGR02444 family)